MTETALEKLVVVGNGMAGIRAVEEILARGGSDRFEVTVFGDEPYGNYNRILLSNVLAGSDDPSDIYLNEVDWYAENGISLRAGVRVVRIDPYARIVHSDDGSATSLQDAIQRHDGQAVGVTAAFNALNSTQQQDLITFLMSL